MSKSFGIGDIVKIDDDFEGSVTVAGWKQLDIEGYHFEVVPFEDYRQVSPQFAKTIKNSPTKKGEIFLKHKDYPPFAFSPPSALMLVKANAVCNCDMMRLLRGGDHLNTCPEKGSAR